MYNTGHVTPVMDNTGHETPVQLPVQGAIWEQYGHNGSIWPLLVNMAKSVPSSWAHYGLSATSVTPGHIGTSGHICHIWPRLATFGLIWPLLDVSLGMAYGRLGLQGPCLTS